LGFGCLALLLLWELGARLAGSELIFPGPLPVLKRFFRLLETGRFYRSLAFSFLRVLSGILLSVPLGVVTGIVAGLNKKAGAFVDPFFTVITATPVMSVILIAFLAFGQDRTPVFTAFLMIFPVMAANTRAGVRSVDEKLKELFRVYRIPLKEKLCRLYIPAIIPFIFGGLRSSLSLCWKVVAAAEVLVQPLHALGTGMQRAKALLETPELFAWTLAAVSAAALSECLLGLVLRVCQRKRGRS
jgi:NitT/TauT family transport system permease protein